MKNEEGKALESVLQLKEVCDLVMRCVSKVLPHAKLRQKESNTGGTKNIRFQEESSSSVKLIEMNSVKTRME